MDGFVIKYVSTLMHVKATPCMPSIYFSIKQRSPNSGDTMEVDFAFRIGIKWRFGIICGIGITKG